jgi:hypothetical protein
MSRPRNCPSLGVTNLIWGTTDAAAAHRPGRLTRGETPLSCQVEADPEGRKLHSEVEGGDDRQDVVTSRLKLSAKAKASSAFLKTICSALLQGKVKGEDQRCLTPRRMGMSWSDTLVANISVCTALVMSP